MNCLSHVLSLLCLSTALVLSACSDMQSSGPALGDNSQNALDWAGTYEGLLPCADCPGIRTTLVLNQDLSYRLSREYLESAAEIFTQSGRFSWNASGSAIALDSNDASSEQYLVGENRLIQLDADGKRITGPLADLFILTKNPAPASPATLADTRWILTELGGQPATMPAAPANPVYIRFVDAEKRVEGFAGCNQFFGSYELVEPLQLRLSDIGSTRRACADGASEAALLEALQQVDNFTIDGSRLALNRARMAPLAVFSAAPSP